MSNRRIKIQASARSGSRFQHGMTLMETMISLALSLVVTSAMVILMANSLGTTTRVIQIGQLTDELRNTMSMLSRDIRRANYSANAAYCYANSDCGISGADPDGSTLNTAVQWGEINIPTATAAIPACVTFGLDRNADGNAATDPAGGFRQRMVGGVGVIEMWIGDNAPNCATANSASWVAITDPDFVHVTSFVVNDADSFSNSVLGEAGSTITQRTRRIQIQIIGELIRDNTITRTIEDVIRVRNDMITKTTV